MDTALLISLASAILMIIISLTIYISRNTTDSKQAENVNVPIRRTVGVRNNQRRMQRQETDSDNNQEPDATDIPSSKIGAKKRAKLEAKAEKKAQREAAELEREDRKKRDQLLQEQRDKDGEREKAEQLKQEEAEENARREKERQEHEVYLKMKETFSIQEEGYDENEDTTNENMLKEFVDRIKRAKVVILEDLACQFGLKTTSVVDRIKDLQSNGSLTGVIDDRGKFIYISQNELESVAKFVKQRGRVSINELVENSNKLIDLCN